MKRQISVLITYIILIVSTISLSSCSSILISTEKNTSKTETQTYSTQATNIVTSISSTTDYEFIKSAHDWIIINTSYDTTQPTSSIPNSSFSSAGLFETHLAVCQGYALAFEELIDAKGIECKVVYGQAGGISHAWNLVKLEGLWYHVDTTWDDPLIDGVNGSGSSNLSYDYFLMPDSVITQTHSISYVIDNNDTSNKETAPVSDSTTYVFYPKSFGISTAITLSTINEMPQKYYESLHNGNASVTFFFPESETYSDAIISDLQYYVASRDGSCSGFSLNISETSFVGYKYITLIPK